MKKNTKTMNLVSLDVARLLLEQDEKWSLNDLFLLRGVSRNFKKATEDKILEAADEEKDLLSKNPKITFNALKHRGFLFSLINLKTRTLNVPMDADELEWTFQELESTLLEPLLQQPKIVNVYFSSTDCITHEEIRDLFALVKIHKLTKEILLKYRFLNINEFYSSNPHSRNVVFTKEELTGEYKHLVSGRYLHINRGFRETHLHLLFDFPEILDVDKTDVVRTIFRYVCNNKTELKGPKFNEFLAKYSDFLEPEDWNELTYFERLKVIIILCSKTTNL